MEQRGAEYASSISSMSCSAASDANSSGSDLVMSLDSDLVVRFTHEEADVLRMILHGEREHWGQALLTQWRKHKHTPSGNMFAYLAVLEELERKLTRWV